MRKLFLIASVCVGLMAKMDAGIAMSYCSSSGLTCMTDADCLPDEICFSGGGVGSCTDSLQCPGGYYCKFTSGGSIGTCTPYPDCFNGCPDCNTTAWSAHSSGYEKRAVATCDTTFCTCTKKTEYRCAAGYYGTSTNGASGCTRCPSFGGGYGSSAAGSTVITNCYISSGSSFAESTGSGTYTSNCYYGK